LSELFEKLRREVVQFPPCYFKEKFAGIYETLEPYAKVFRERWVDFGEDAIREFLRSNTSRENYLVLEGMMFRAVVSFATRKLNEEEAWLQEQNPIKQVAFSEQRDNFWENAGAKILFYARIQAYYSRNQRIANGARVFLQHHDPQARRA
jgi:hypothetical protein